MSRADAVAILKSAPPFLVAMKAERTRLSGMRGPVPLVDCCAVSKMNLAALSDILRQVAT